MTPDETRAVIPRLATIYDEPFADASQIPTFLISQLARAGVTVALSGDGGDEVFGGYNRYVTGMRLWSRLSVVPRPARTALAPAPMEAVPPRGWDKLGSIADRVAARVVARAADRQQGPQAGDGPRPGRHRRPVPAPRVHLARPGRLVAGGHELPIPTTAGPPRPPRRPHRMMLADLLGYLPDDILVKVDRASMARQPRGTGPVARPPGRRVRLAAAARPEDPGR